MTEKKQAPARARVEQAALVRTIGARMREARELCNLSQSAAARRLGYSNPSKLSKVEGATDTNSVPMLLILRAAKAYEVSVDFLFGITDDWEVGARMTQEREVSAWLWEANHRAHVREMATLKRLHDRVQVIQESVIAMLEAGDGVDAALARFAELNPGFEDMRAGSRLVGAIERVNIAVKNSKTKMARLRLECATAAADSPQMNLAL